MLMQGLVLAPGAVTAENMSAHVRMCGAETVGKPFGPGVVATSGPGAHGRCREAAAMQDRNY